MVYKTKGTCSSEIEFEVENGILTDIHFVGGCQGNTTGVAALAKGLPIDEVIDKLSGIQCGFRGKLKDKEVVIVQSGIGKVNMA